MLATQEYPHERKYHHPKSVSFAAMETYWNVYYERGFGFFMNSHDAGAHEMPTKEYDGPCDATIVVAEILERVMDKKTISSRDIKHAIVNRTVGSKHLFEKPDATKVDKSKVVALCAQVHERAENVIAITLARTSMRVSSNFSVTIWLINALEFIVKCTA